MAAQNTAEFDGRSLADRPPRLNSPKTAVAAPALPRAAGRPSLAQQASGRDNLRANPRTLQASDSRPTSSTGRGPALPQSFTADKV